MKRVAGFRLHCNAAIRTPQNHRQPLIIHNCAIKTNFQSQLQNPPHSRKLHLVINRSIFVLLTISPKQTRDTQRKKWRGEREQKMRTAQQK